MPNDSFRWKWNPRLSGARSLKPDAIRPHLLSTSNDSPLRSLKIESRRAGTPQTVKSLGLRQQSSTLSIGSNMAPNQHETKRSPSPLRKTLDDLRQSCERASPQLQRKLDESRERVERDMAPPGSEHNEWYRNNLRQAAYDAIAAMEATDNVSSRSEGVSSMLGSTTKKRLLLGGRHGGLSQESSMLSVRERPAEESTVAGHDDSDVQNKGSTSPSSTHVRLREMRDRLMGLAQASSALDQQKEVAGSLENISPTRRRDDTLSPHERSSSRAAANSSTGGPLDRNYVSPKKPKVLDDEDPFWTDLAVNNASVYSGLAEDVDAPKRFSSNAQMDEFEMAWQAIERQEQDDLKRISDMANVRLNNLKQRGRLRSSHESSPVGVLRSAVGVVNTCREDGGAIGVTAAIEELTRQREQLERDLHDIAVKEEMLGFERSLSKASVSAKWNTPGKTPRQVATSRTPQASASKAKGHTGSTPAAEKKSRILKDLADLTEDQRAEIETFLRMGPASDGDNQATEKLHNAPCADNHPMVGFYSPDQKEHVTQPFNEKTATLATPSWEEVVNDSCLLQLSCEKAATPESTNNVDMSLSKKSDYAEENDVASVSEYVSSSQAGCPPIGSVPEIPSPFVSRHRAVSRLSENEKFDKDSAESHVPHPPVMPRRQYLSFSLKDQNECSEKTLDGDYLMMYCDYYDSFEPRYFMMAGKHATAIIRWSKSPTGEECGRMVLSEVDGFYHAQVSPSVVSGNPGRLSDDHSGRLLDVITITCAGKALAFSCENNSQYAAWVSALQQKIPSGISLEETCWE